MLLCETGGVGRARRRGSGGLRQPARTRSASMPGSTCARCPSGLNRNAQFDLAPYLFDGALGAGDRVVLVGAERLTDQQARRAAPPRPRRRPAMPRDRHLRDAQAIIGAKAKLSYVFGARPGDLQPRARPAPAARRAAAARSSAFRARPAPRTAPRLLLVAPDLEEPRPGRALIALALVARLRARGADRRQDASRRGSRAHGTDDRRSTTTARSCRPTSPRASTSASVFAAAPTNYRLQCLVANLAVSRRGAARRHQRARAVARRRRLHPGSDRPRRARRRSSRPRSCRTSPRSPST